MNIRFMNWKKNGLSILPYAVLISIVIVPDAFAFVEPIVNKVNQGTQYGLTVAKALVGLGFAWFLIGCAIGRRDINILVGCMIAGAFAAGFSPVYQWFIR